MIYVFPFLVASIGITFWLVLAARRNGRPQYLDLGWAYVAIVTLYGLVPSVGLLLAHLGIGEIQDARLSAVDVSLVESVQRMHLAFLTSFAILYLLVRRFAAAPVKHSANASGARNWLIATAMLLAFGQPLVLWALGVPAAEDYISTYTRLRDMPLIVQQLFGVANQLALTALIAAVVFAIAVKPKAHALVALLLCAYVVYAALTGGSRTVAFLCLFAYLVAASIYVPGFSTARILLIGIPGMLLFMLGGLLREQGGDGRALGLLQGGEFVSLFVNAMDLKQRFEYDVAPEIRAALYFVDLLRLIPAQLVGGEKLDPAAWYVEAFYPDYHDAGGGLAFGVLAESAAGLGAVEAAARGALLGAFFAWVSNRLLESGHLTPTHVFIYVWLVTQSYQSYRDTTFSLVARVVYHVLPILLPLLVLGPRRRGGPGHALHSSPRGS